MEYILLFVIIIVFFLINIIGNFFNYYAKKNWRQFAKANHLLYDNDHSIHGFYNGYFLLIRNEIVGKKPLTNFSLTKKKDASKNIVKYQNDKEILDRFWAIYDQLPSGYWTSVTSDVKNLEITSEKVLFLTNIITKKSKLRYVCDQLYDMIEIYPYFCMIEGDVVGALLNSKPFKPMIWDLIQSISAETEIKYKQSKYKHRCSSLLCKKCFTFCSPYMVKAPTIMILYERTTYYGCRICKQIGDFVEGISIAVLDNQMTAKWLVQGDEISVNWLSLRKPFDFYQVRIIQASDKEVEEFVMQVGNDTDEFRQSRYKKLPCKISPDCKLSENTLRILKHTFQSVTEI